MSWGPKSLPSEKQYCKVFYKYVTIYEANLLFEDIWSVSKSIINNNASISICECFG